MRSTLRVASWAALAVAAMPALAQPAPRSPVAGSAASAPLPGGLPASASGFRSAFEGYPAFRDEPVRTWREVNDQVGRIGGWRTYARESQGGASAPAGAGHAGHGSGTPAPAAANRPAASGPSTGGHAGHGR